MIFDSRRYLSVFAVFALVMLRLVVGWHFFREGSQKVVYDEHDGDWRMKFSAEGFLKNAKGPMAGMYTASVPGGHDWRELLASPRQNKPATEEESADQARWQTDYENRRAEAKSKGELQPVEFPESAPYQAWAERIAADWRSIVDNVKAIPALSDEQKKQADTALSTQLQALTDYLNANSEAITEYRHEEWRLANWRESPESGDVPFVDGRIVTKTTETAGTPKPWVAQVDQFDAELSSNLRNLLNEEQLEQATTTAAIDDALSDPNADRLDLINIVVTFVTIGVGICLLTGFLTRFASIVGALFLLGVILSQPPWLADAAPTMPNIIEFTALLVLAGTGAGRWAGLDYFTYALFGRRREADVVIR